MAAYEEEEQAPVKIGDLNRYSRRIYTIVKVVSITEPREVSSRIDRSTHRVAEALVGDETGSIYLTLWDDAIDQVEVGQTLSIRNAYINLFRGSMRLALGRFGSFEVMEESPIEEVNLDNNLSSKRFEYWRSSDRGGESFRDRRGRRGRRRY